MTSIPKVSLLCCSTLFVDLVTSFATHEHITIGSSVHLTLNNTTTMGNETLLHFPNGNKWVSFADVVGLGGDYYGWQRMVHRLISHHFQIVQDWWIHSTGETSMCRPGCVAPEGSWLLGVEEKKVQDTFCTRYKQHTENYFFTKIQHQNNFVVPPQ